MYNILHVHINGFISVFVGNVIVCTNFARKGKIIGKNGTKVEMWIFFQVRNRLSPHSLVTTKSVGEH
jgi:hypothetical protein